MGGYLKDFRLTLGNHPFYSSVWKSFLHKKKKKSRAFMKATQKCGHVGDILVYTCVYTPSDETWRSHPVVLLVRIHHTVYTHHSTCIFVVCSLCFYVFIQHNRLRKHGVKLILYHLWCYITFRIDGRDWVAMATGSSVSGVLEVGGQGWK